MLHIYTFVKFPHCSLSNKKKKKKPIIKKKKSRLDKLVLISNQLLQLFKVNDTSISNGIRKLGITIGLNRGINLK